MLDARIGAGTIREPCKIKTPDAMYSHHKQIDRVRASTHHSQASPGRRLLSTLTPFALRTKLRHVTVCDDIVLRADGKDRVREDRCDEGEYTSCAYSVAPRLRACSLRTERLDIRRQRHALARSAATVALAGDDVSATSSHETAGWFLVQFITLSHGTHCIDRARDCFGGRAQTDPTSQSAHAQTHRRGRTNNNNTENKTIKASIHQDGEASSLNGIPTAEDFATALPALFLTTATRTRSG